MSVCVVHGQNGGAGLAVKVVGGTQKPSTKRQGTIWVNTDQKITGWSLQAEEPSAPSDGMVWVGINTVATLNAEKKNGLWVTPTFAKQYSDGAWVKKTGEYCNNGKWSLLFSATIRITYPAGSSCTISDGISKIAAPDTSGIWDCVVQNAGTWTVTLTDKGWSDAVTVTDDKSTVNLDITKLWLYKHGDERLSVTNGWVHRRRVSSFWSADGTSTKNSESATVATTTGTNYSSASGLVTSQAIDLTNISRIYANVSAFQAKISNDASKGGLMILSTEEVIQFGQGDAAHSMFMGTGIDSVDVSALSGYYYVGIIVSADKSVNTGAYCSLTFTEVYAV